MDEMNIGSKFMRGIVEKLIKRTIKKKFGYDLDIQINGLNVKYIDGKAKLHLDVDAELDKNELTKILKQAGLED